MGHHTIWREAALLVSTKYRNIVAEENAYLGVIFAPIGIVEQTSLQSLA